MAAGCIGLYDTVDEAAGRGFGWLGPPVCFFQLLPGLGAAPDRD